MAYETLIRRIIYVSVCPDCGDSDIRIEQPPRERFCKCGKWVPYREEAYTGPPMRNL